MSSGKSRGGQVFLPHLRHDGSDWLRFEYVENAVAEAKWQLQHDEIEAVQIEKVKK